MSAPMVPDPPPNADLVRVPGTFSARCHCGWTSHDHPSPYEAGRVLANHQEDRHGPLAEGRGYYAERCCVPWCEFPRLASSPCCYGHTVDENDPRHIPIDYHPPAQSDGSGPDA